MREIIFDTETTGRSADDGDRIVEIGCVEIVNLSPTGRTFHAYVNPERDVPEEVVRVHGLTGAFLRDKPVFARIVDDLLEFFGDSPIVAHNAAFDRAFLNAELKRLQREPIPTELLIAPANSVPASVTPRCNGTSGRRSANRRLTSITFCGSESFSDTQYRV